MRMGALGRRLGGNLRGDLFGGVTAGVVALPLALGFGVASGLPDGAAVGLYGAIAVGVFAALFGGTPSQVSGPTGPMTVVAATIALQLKDPALVFAAVLLGGALQIVAGLLRLGRLVMYVPYPVVSGFMTGIGAIVVALQLPALVGHPAAANPVAGLLAVPAALAAPNVAALALAAGTMAMIYGLPRLTTKVPGTLVALIAMTAVAAGLGLDVPRISAIPSGLPRPSLPPLGAALGDPAIRDVVLRAAVVFAALGSIDSLLTSLVADRVTGTRHDARLELVGQGLGNVVAALVGGLPGAGATMRTVVNVRSGGRTHLSGVVHGVLLIGVLLGLGRLASEVPLAVLAGVLVTVGLGILDMKGLRHAVRAPRGDAAVMLVVLLITVFGDLIVAVAAGTVVSSLLLAKRVGDQGAPSSAPSSADGAQVLRLDGPLFFGNAQALTDAAARLGKPRAVVVAMDGVTDIDQSGAYALEEAVGGLRAGGADVWLSGVSDPVRVVLERLEVVTDLLQLRGRSPLALVPVANPRNAATLAQVAAFLSPPRVGRALLLRVVGPDEDLSPLADALTPSLAVAVRAGVPAEFLATVASDPWAEIARVARTYRCDVTLVGASSLSDPAARARLETLSAELDGSLAILRAPPGWDPTATRRVLVPVGGAGSNIALRARLLTAMHQRAERLDVRYLLVVPAGTAAAQRDQLRAQWSERVRVESEAAQTVEVVESADVEATLLERAAWADLVVLGLDRADRTKPAFRSEVVARVAEGAPGAVLLVGQRA